jgi:hypothetical protein
MDRVDSGRASCDIARCGEVAVPERLAAGDIRPPLGTRGDSYDNALVRASSGRSRKEESGGTGHERT